MGMCNVHGHEQRHEHGEHEPEEALVVKEVAAGMTTDTLCVPLLVQHCQEEPASMVISIGRGIEERVPRNVCYFFKETVEQKDYEKMGEMGHLGLKVSCYFIFRSWPPTINASQVNSE